MRRCFNRKVQVVGVVLHDHAIQPRRLLRGVSVLLSLPFVTRLGPVLQRVCGWGRRNHAGALSNLSEHARFAPARRREVVAPAAFSATLVRRR